MPHKYNQTQVTSIETLVTLLAQVANCGPVARPLAMRCGRDVGEMWECCRCGSGYGARISNSYLQNNKHKQNMYPKPNYLGILISLVVRILVFTTHFTLKLLEEAVWAGPIQLVGINMCKHIRRHVQRITVLMVALK